MYGRSISKWNAGVRRRLLRAHFLPLLITRPSPSQGRNSWYPAPDNGFGSESNTCLRLKQNTAWYKVMMIRSIRHKSMIAYKSLWPYIYRLSPKKVYSTILDIIQKQYNVMILFFHTLLIKCLFICVQNFKCVSCVSTELWTRENSPIKLGFVHELPMLCITM